MKSMHPMGVLVAVLLMSCSPAPLSEEELLQGLVEMEQHGPYQFKAQTWPRLVDKTITYCGTITEVDATDAGSRVTLNLEKTPAGEDLSWSLEGKSDSPALAREYAVGDPICLTGIFESYVAVEYYEPPYRGTVKLTSWEKPVAT